MTPTELHDALLASGRSLSERDGKLMVGGGKISAEDSALIKEHRDALLAMVMPKVPAEVKVVKPLDIDAVMKASPSGFSTLGEAQALLEQASVIGIDFETTGLNHRQDKPRLLSFCDGKRALVVDCFRENWQALIPALQGKTLIAHNMAFDAGWLWQAGCRDLPNLICTWLLAEVLEAGLSKKGWCSLQGCARRYLDYELDKEQQKSKWGEKTLSPEQITYARKDAVTHLAVFQHEQQALRVAGLTRIGEIECAALPCWIWMQQSGVLFDKQAWEALATQAEVEVKRFQQELDDMAPQPEQGGLFGPHTWDWGSWQQVKEAFSILGIELESTDDEHLAAVQHPFAEKVRDWRGWSKLATTYGKEWLQMPWTDGRIYANWRQIGTKPGRSSCDEPNFQNIPKKRKKTDGDYRGCFVAPAGKVLVKADYSQLQLRIAARVSQDANLLKIYQQHGGDVHTATGRAMLGKMNITDGERKIAKSCNFSQVFGAGAFRLQAYAMANFDIPISITAAQQHRAAFFKAYPGLKAWHERTRKEAVTETRTRMGRRVILHEDAYDTHRLNFPVQGDEVDGAKQALAILWNTRGEVPSARPIMLIHDEIVVECDEQDGACAGEWLKCCMEEGMREILDPVQCVVDVAVKKTWGE